MTLSLCFDQLHVGDQWTSPARTITEADVVQFAGLTGDFDPLHMDHEFARATPFGQPIVHGLLGLSLVAGLGSHSPRPNTLALVEVRDWKFLKPVFIHDTVHVATEVIAKRPKGRRCGQVSWRRRLVNQHGETVQEGVFETLVAVSVLPAKRKDPAQPRPAGLQARSLQPSASAAACDHEARAVEALCEAELVRENGRHCDARSPGETGSAHDTRRPSQVPPVSG
jgi:acyl dehydratase